MAEKLLVPIYLPQWLHQPIRKLKRAFMPPAVPKNGIYINIEGERNIEWSFLSREMPDGPGEAIEFGCERGYLSLLAAQKGFHVIANDLQEQVFTWRHPNVEFRQGDFLKLELPREFFDLAINCSSVEHVGLVGRYGIDHEQRDGDIEVMRRIARVLKAGGLLLMTAPVGLDAVMEPWCRVYGEQRLPKLLAPFTVAKASYWAKNERNQWSVCAREDALSFPPRHDRENPHGCAYALGCFVLRRRD